MLLKQILEQDIAQDATLIDGEWYITVPKPFECYSVSNTGKVISTKIIGGQGTVGKPRQMKLEITSNGYYSVALGVINKQVQRISVHRLVAYLFIPNPNKLPIVNHIDGNRLNCCTHNLEWCTFAHNTQHSVQILGKNRGEGSGTAKTNNTEVKEIRRMYSDGRTIIDIAKHVGLGKSMIWNIVSGASWKHV